MAESEADEFTVTVSIDVKGKSFNNAVVESEEVGTEGGWEDNEKEKKREEVPLQNVLKHPLPEKKEQIVQHRSSEESLSKGKNGKRKLTPMWALFRFADFWDVLMILVGFFFAVAAGLAIPGHLILFGRVINQFSYYTSTTSKGSSFGNVSLTSLANEYANSVNETCSVALLLQGPLFSRGFGENLMLLCDPQNGDVFSNVVEFACDPAAQLLTNVNVFSVYYVSMALSVLLAVFLANIFFNISAYRQTRRIRHSVYHSVLHQEIGWFDMNSGSELNTRLSDDVEKIQAGIGDKLVLFTGFISTFIAGFIIAFSISWKMALVMCSVLPLLVFMSATIAKVVATFTVREQSVYAAAGALAEEVISSIRTVVAFGGEVHEVERYNVQLNKAKKEGFKRSLLTSLSVSMLQMIIFCSFALGFWYGSTLIIGCELSAGDVVTIFISILVGSFSLGNALPELETFGSAMGAATVIFELIDIKSKIDSSSEEGLMPDKLLGKIEFKDVVFHYPARPDVQVAKGLNFEIKPGQTVALVGPSGCGKSTVIQLLQRFYSQDSGQITIDDHEVASLNLKWLRGHIGVVSQEPVLFNTTIAENIRYGKEDATIEEVQEAARMANAHDFICNLPKGYDTDVGDCGAQMSGGQKQRIAIARALVKDPKILLLDEATSALDNESEKVVQDALDLARKGRTTIVIAHRLTTIHMADEIVSIKGGVVVEHGTHLELMDNEGLYYELVTAQTIVETESDEGLADFKATVRHVSSSSGGRRHHSYNRQPSERNQENLLTVAEPSSQPGQVTCLNLDNNVSLTSSCKKEEVVEGKSLPSASTTLVARRGSKTSKADDTKLRDISFLELLRLNKPDWPIVLLGVVASAVIGTLFPIMAPHFSEVLRIYTLNDADEIASQIAFVCAGFVGLAFFAGASYFTGFFSLGISGERLTKRLRYNTFKAILNQDVGWFDLKANSTGALTTRLATDAADVKGSTGIKLGVVLQTLFGFIAALTISLHASWELTLVFVLAFPFLGFFSFIQIRLLTGRAQKNKERLEASGNVVVESVMNIRTVVGLGVEDRFYNNYTSLLLGPFKDNIKSVFLQGFVLGLAQSTIFFIYSIGYSFGAFLVVEERATFDQLFRVFAAVVFTAFSLGRASSFSPDASKSKLAAARILALQERKPPIEVSSTEGSKLESTCGKVDINSVHFSYPTRPDVKVLQGMNVNVQPGQTLALVGPSGCGKSTVVSLVERFYDPSMGSMALEGVDLKDLNLMWLRTQIGLVSQEPVLFDASIAENIQYGALFREVSDDEIMEAARSANIHSFIESLPEGYQTNVGAKGTQLSGGQKQRIAIARALVRDPKILLLDEATSALDTESEKIVQEALDKAREGRTTIIIAHRLTTIYNSDVIAVIHNGQVIECGTHAELMAKHGAYYHLNTIQLQEYDEDDMD